MFANSELIESWIQFLNVSGKSPLTLKMYRSTISEWSRWCICSDVMMPDASRATVIGWMSKMKNAGLSNDTIRSKTMTVSSFYCWACDEGICTENPTAKVPRPPQDPQKVRALPLDAIQSILEVPWTRNIAGVRDRALLQLLAESGLRRAEVAGIHLSDIDFANKNIFIRKGKGGKSRYVFVGDSGMHWISKWIDKRAELTPTHDFLFCKDRGNMAPFAPDGISSIFSKYAKLLEIAGDVEVYPSGARRHKFHPHAMRHSCLSDLLRVSGNLRLVQIQAGHASIVTTQRYLHVPDADRCAAVQAHSAGLTLGTRQESWQASESQRR